eukprot:30972-Pelagococcus_subviridis.AAC.10
MRNPCRGDRRRATTRRRRTRRGLRIRCPGRKGGRSAWVRRGGVVSQSSSEISQSGRSVTRESWGGRRAFSVLTHPRGSASALRLRTAAMTRDGRSFLYGERRLVECADVECRSLVVHFLRKYPSEDNGWVHVYESTFTSIDIVVRFDARAARVSFPRPSFRSSLSISSHPVLPTLLS